MPASEAQIRANQANGARSKGPITAEGKAISRQNSVKHGLSGQGIVLPEKDLEEIDRRAEAFEKDMKPCSPAGWVLLRRLATLSVLMENSTRHEIFARAKNVRHAVDDFDEARLDEADDLFDALSENPRRNLRKLRKSPEGVDRLIEAWTHLKADLRLEPRPIWTASHLERAANMVGLSIDHVRSTRLGALARAVRGDFEGLDPSEGGHLDEKARQLWARNQLVERIDLEIAELEAHRLTLDLETIELDRAEASERARFDVSKEGILARRYDSELQRNYFKALKEFRQVEAECLERASSDPTPLPPPLPPPPQPDRLGSSREARVPAPVEFDKMFDRSFSGRILQEMMAKVDAETLDRIAKMPV